MKSASPLVVFALLGCSSAATPDAGFEDGASPIDGAVDRDVSSPVDAAPPPPAVAFPPPYLSYVDPTVGTGGFSFNDIGSAHPGPQWPYGFARPGPDTTDENGQAATFLHCSGYHAQDQYIRGFSQLRMHGVGINDYGVVALMPTLGFDASRAASSVGLVTHFDKAREVARPDLYRVVLDDPRFLNEPITVEATALPHTSLYRFTFPATEHAQLVFDLAHAHPGVRIEAGSLRALANASEVEGTIRFLGGYSGRFGGSSAHFVARFDRSATVRGTFASTGLVAAGAEDAVRAGNTGGLYLEFDTRTDQTIEVAISMSLVDVDGARRNLDRESPMPNIEAARAQLERAWEERLAQVALEGRDESDARIFYTALYHASFMPTLASDVDGRYRGLDHEVHQLEAGQRHYTDLSLWDTYRTLHPLIALLQPGDQTQMVQSLLRMGDEYRVFPRWPLADGESEGMLGDPAVIVIADSLLSEVPNIDAARALTIALRGADGMGVMDRGRFRHLPAWQSAGYISSDIGGSVSLTQEYAYADYAIARIAERAGESAVAARFDERARNYANVFDRNSSYFVARNASGAFEMLNPANGTDYWSEAYAEGNARQYLWLAPQDPMGLMELLGGSTPALDRLRDFYLRSTTERRTGAPPIYYFQGNEPDIHAPFLASLWGDPSLAAEFSSWARRVHFRLGPQGLPGNDDSGTMSAWYVFASLGFYPFAGTDRYVIGSPLFTRATLSLEGRELVVEAPRAVHEGFVPSRVTLDGVEVTGGAFSHAALRAGHTLRFE